MSKKQKIDLAYLRSIKAITTLQGREYLTHPGLLRVATEHGLTAIKTEVVHGDWDKQSFYMVATVSGERGTFTGHGDANSKNVNRNIAPHAFRMAETRAVGRALRYYLGLGMTLQEELAGRGVPDEPVVPKTIDEEVATISSPTARRIQRFMLVFERAGVVNEEEKRDLVEAASAVHKKQDGQILWQRPGFRSLREMSEAQRKIASHNVVAWWESGDLARLVLSYASWKRDGSKPMAKEAGDGAE